MKQFCRLLCRKPGSSCQGKGDVDIPHFTKPENSHRFLPGSRGAAMCVLRSADALLMHLIHRSIGLFAALRDHIYFVYMNGAGSFVQRTLYRHPVSHVIFERVGIIYV